ncbi:MAG: hypothetical protein Q8J84_00360 [Flavobacteriaceae bacterium]|nr:hypothetical protein [Flavobacteriaceae bacterium]
MDTNHKNNLILIFSLIFISALILINSQNAFFWDTVQLGSLHSNFYFSSNFSNILLPDHIDSGHIPAFGMYIALMWKIFERSLLVSHLAMFPFAIGIVFQLYKLAQKFTPKKYWGYAMVLILIDPSLLSQMILVSPDVPLIFFFLLAVNSVLYNKRSLIMLSVIFLFLISMRGMMLSFCILLFDLYLNLHYKNYKETALDLLKRSLIYLPAFLIFVSFSIFHYNTKGWIGFHPNSPWAESFESVGTIGFIYNIAVLGWMILDFGKIGIWIVFTILLIIYRNKILKDPKSQILLFLFICIVLLLPANMLWAKGLLGHRYLIPIYLIFALLGVNILFSAYIKNKLRYVMIIIWSSFIISGNFWIYPPKIAQGWDSTLAHIPYYNLRINAIKYLDKEKIEISKVASFFPNTASFDAIDLNNDQRRFSKFNEHNKYLFYSNIFNISDQEYNRIINDYIPIKSFKKNGIFVWICKKKERQLFIFEKLDLIMTHNTNYNPMQIVLISSFIHEIQIAQLKLEHHGIPSIIVDENLNSIIGTSFVEGYKLKVFVTDFEEAKSIIHLNKSDE